MPIFLCYYLILYNLLNNFIIFLNNLQFSVIISIEYNYILKYDLISFNSWIQHIDLMLYDKNFDWDLLRYLLNYK